MSRSIVLKENVETCEQPTDDDIVAAVTAPAEPASPAPRPRRRRRRRETQPPRASTGYGGLRHFAALPAGHQ